MRQGKRTSRLARAALAGWLGGLISISCAQVLGDIEVETESLEPGGPSITDPPPSNASLSGEAPPVACEPGASRCSEGVLQVCVRVDAGRPAGWLDQYDCGTPELCSDGPPAVCLRPACQAGEASCSGATPRRCNAGQTGWDELPACESAAHCSPLAAECPEGAPCCLVEPCEPGELRCNEGHLEQCQADLSGWSALAACDTPELCLSGLASCGAGAASCGCDSPVCAEGEVRCTGSLLERCNIGRTGWDVVSECGSPELCALGLELEPVRCEPPACAPGQFTCEGAALRACRPDLTSFVDSERCVGPAFCNAGAGRCDPAPCVAGERSCNGAQIQVCASDSTGFLPDGPPCATPELCNDDDPASVRCEPPVCNVDQFECFGTNQLQVCNRGRTGFDNAAPPCLRPDLCSAARRRCDFCFPGRQECTPDLTASRVCALSGNFFGPETFCPLGCVSATGQCRTCTLGEYACSGGNLQRCNDGRSFTPLNRSTDCSNGQQVVCSNGGVVQRNSCPAGLFCGGTGQCVCTPGPAFCDGDDLLVCNGSAIVPADQCQGPDGDVLTTCDDGDLEQDLCDSAAECEQSSGSTCDDLPGNGNGNGFGNGNGNGNGFGNGFDFDDD